MVAGAVLEAGVAGGVLDAGAAGAAGAAGSPGCYSIEIITYFSNA